MWHVLNVVLDITSEVEVDVEYDVEWNPMDVHVKFPESQWAQVPCT